MQPAPQPRAPLQSSSQTGTASATQPPGVTGPPSSPSEAEIPRHSQPGSSGSSTPIPPGATASLLAPGLPPYGRSSPPVQKAQTSRGGRVIAPLLIYMPETHVGLGALLVQFFRPPSAPKASRVSSVAALALVTTRQQAVFELIPEIYWDHENYSIAGKAEYQRYPDSFWGIGPRTPEKDEERYERRRARWRGGPRRRLVGNLFAGLLVDAMWFKGIYTDPTGLFAQNEVPGEAGGITVGAGPTLALDSRDNTVATRRGTLLSGTYIWFGHLIGSRYEFMKLILEARHFILLGGEHVLGFRLAGEFQQGNVPFYHLAYFGGDELLRGYFLGRYRDKTLVALEAEYRFPLIWKFGGTAFAGAAEVDSRLAGLDLDPVRWAGGGGLRFSLNDEEHLNLRLDIGAGPGTFGTYFTAREAF